ncbi:DUF1302 domain-containing protein [Solimicrobium silvestre]|uniref:DUF1302 domain-containing protein n=1 Tax=Solimicrobium silvestre TaxID=2099400 RepID=A0A2S9H5C8_9BURK|nr:DUF1302 family protein [Solimicrobium silvestre]PRC95168.1 hypothetical protein S2091_0363 [Solimicrobium silvestre]
MNHRKISLFVASAIAIMTDQVYATDIEIADGTLTVNATVVAGTALRTENPNPSLLSPANAKAIGLSGISPNGGNGDDGDLNYKRWSQTSTILKGYLDLDYVNQNYGAHMGIKAWNDFALENQNVLWGNLPNGYANGTPLSDKGFSSEAKFNGAELTSMYLYGENEIGEGKVEWKIGEQSWNWGRDFQIGCGLNDLLVRDNNALVRPGALPEETVIPIPALRAVYSVTPSTSIDMIVQTRFQSNAALGCGTFYSQVDFVSNGCNQIIVANAITAPEAISKGFYVTRAGDIKPGNAAQGGIGIRQDIPSLDSTVGLYLAQFDSRQFFYGTYKSTNAIPFLPSNPNNGNPQYALEYPGDIRMVGLTYDIERSEGNILAELTYRPDQPYHYNTIDLLNAFVSNTASTPLRGLANSTQAGQLFNGYEKMKAVQFNLSATQTFSHLMAADVVTLIGEFAVKVAPDLPDQSVMRFGRPMFFGSAPIGGAACQSSLTQMECSNAGYDTRSSWGYKLRLNFDYPQLVAGVDFDPKISFAQDVRGWSDDGVFSQGRKFAVIDLKTIYHKSINIDLVWIPTWGGDFNPMSDRSTLGINVGYKF